jgi:hypothetical protein
MGARSHSQITIANLTRPGVVGAMSEFGSGLGADSNWQMRPDAAPRADHRSLTWADAPEQSARIPARPVRDEEAAGSNPATPTTKSQVNGVTCCLADLHLSVLTDSGSGHV